MKNIIIIWLMLATSSAAANVFSLEIALEAEGFQRVEYYSRSHHGLVALKGCELCTQKIYKFETLPKIFKEGKAATMESLLKSYRTIRWPTLFIDPTTHLITKISY
ncbi:MAG: hypothetical protein RPR40_04615 [Bermanella sp.]|jgi:hypothetical protein